MNWLAKRIFFDLLNWKIVGRWPAEVEKAVVVVAPHTSWHDFYLGLLVRRYTGKNIHYVAKKELFRAPFGWYFKWMGGTPLDRTPGQNKVEAIAQIFDQKDEFLLAIAPEGTRKKVSEWKTGFYYIAQKARVPLILVAFDYGRKQVKFSEPFFTTGDLEQDRKFIKAFYRGVQGKVFRYT